MQPAPKSSDKQPSILRNILLGFVLALFGVGLSFLMIMLILRAFPNLDPRGQRVIFTVLDGDTFRHQPGQVRPPEENSVLEDVVRFDDADGFRQPAIVADSYSIVALGDSFTDGGMRPWVDVLASELDTPVRNLGWSGFGPVEYARIMQDYGRDNNDWVIVAYFEGNDLSNTRTAYERAQETGGTLELDLTRNVSAPITDLRDVEDYQDIITQENGNYLYPLVHPELNNLELAYISDYIWWQNGDRETYQNSRNVEELGNALAEIVEASGDACVALIYVPVKGHIYFEYANPEGNRRYVLENSLELSLDENGWLTFGGLQTVDYDLLMSRMDNQRDVVRDLSESLGIGFIDLVPVFKDNVQGEPLYFTYDSHWNRNGHQLAGETVAQVIQNADGCDLP